MWVSCGALWQGIPTFIRCGPHVGVPTQSSQQFSMGKPTVGLATENQCRTQNSFALLAPQSSWAACSRICFSPCLSVYVCLSMVRTHCGFLPLAEHTSSYQPPAPPDHLIRRPLHKLTCETHFYRLLNYAIFVATNLIILLFMYRPSLEYFETAWAEWVKSFGLSGFPFSPGFLEPLFQHRYLYISLCFLVTVNKHTKPKLCPVFLTCVQTPNSKLDHREPMRVTQQFWEFCGPLCA